MSSNNNAFDLDACLRRLKDAASPYCFLPWSTLIVAMGPHWAPGCKESAEAMRDYAREKADIPVEMIEQRDLCYNWGDALGTMRNAAYRRALEAGMEWLLYLDNDVIAPPWTLLEMLSKAQPIVSPRIQYSTGETYGLATATIPPNGGMVRVGSVPLSCLLVKTTVFRPWALVDFWSDAIGADEEYHAQKLAMAGHLPIIDTDVTVTCVKPPHFPLDEKRKAADVEKARQIRNSKLFLVR